MHNNQFTLLSFFLPGHLWVVTNHSHPIQKTNDAAHIGRKDIYGDKIISLSGGREKINKLINEMGFGKNQLVCICNNIQPVFLGHSLNYKYNNPGTYRVGKVGAEGIVSGQHDYGFSKFSGKKLVK